ncbi:MAG: hypothetical protein ACR2QO_27690 [Acidimicrobiales bacterium]
MATSPLLDRLGLWPARVLWLGLPLAVGRGLSPALERFDTPGPLLVEVCLWLSWFVGLLALLVPTAASLTVVRIVAPAVIGVGLVAGVSTGDWPLELLLAIVAGVLVTAVVFLPMVGDRMVNGSAYGSERRMTLRPPAYTLLGPVQLAWLLVFAGAITGPWLLASGRYVLGGIAVVVGVGFAWLGGRVLHQLSRRWLVFVPAGFVIHDHVVPVESILLRRTTIASLGPATVPVVAEAVDVSGGGRGLALEVSLNEPVVFGLRAGSRRDVVNTEAERLVFTPTLPGAVLTEARIRAIPIGAAL